MRKLAFLEVPSHFLALKVRGQPFSVFSMDKLFLIVRQFTQVGLLTASIILCHFIISGIFPYNLDLSTLSAGSHTFVVIVQTTGGEARRTFTFTTGKKTYICLNTLKYSAGDTPMHTHTHKFCTHKHDHRQKTHSSKLNCMVM